MSRSTSARLSSTAFVSEANDSVLSLWRTANLMVSETAEEKGRTSCGLSPTTCERWFSECNIQSNQTYAPYQAIVGISPTIL